MTFNSTHAAILAIAVIASVAMVTEQDLAQIVPIIAPLGAYAGIREYKRVQNKDGEITKWSGNKEESLETVVD